MGMFAQEVKESEAVCALMRQAAEDAERLAAAVESIEATVMGWRGGRRRPSRRNGRGGAR